MELTYKIIGGDGREYGPIGLTELKAWVQQRRVAPQTNVWRSDRAQWAPASEYPELSSELQAIPQPPLVADEGELAFQPVGFWARLAAYIVDAILLSIVMTFLTWPWREKFDVDTPQPVRDLGELWTMFRSTLLYYGIYTAVSLVYYVALNGRFGATVGKLIVGARIVKADGAPLGYGRALLRYLCAIISWIPLGLGYLFIAFRADKRGLHDLLAGTRVIYRR